MMGVFHLVVGRDEEEERSVEGLVWTLVAWHHLNGGSLGLGDAICDRLWICEVNMIRGIIDILMRCLTMVAMEQSRHYISRHKHCN